MQKAVDFNQLRNAVLYAAKNSPFYQKTFSEKQVEMDRLNTMEDFEKLPFSDKHDLRNAYQLGLQAFRMKRCANPFIIGDNGQPCYHSLHPRGCG